MRFKVYPYKLGSQSAKALALALGVKRVRPTYNARRSDVLINWGNSRCSSIVHASHDLNKHSAIALASNKLKTFNKLNGMGFTNIPDYTAHIEEAESWLQDGHKVYARQTLTGHSGSGIVIVGPSDPLVYAPLYTKETKHKHEYRVHVFKGKVLDIQQKKKRHGTVGGSGIRNHSNGWIYARCDISPPDELLTSAVQAVNILGLDFGAVDIGHRLRDNKIFLFEVNTAPGLVGTTLDKYAQAFRNYLDEVNNEMSFL